MRRIVISALLVSTLSVPAAAAPLDTVKVCNDYGAGFFYIPGTDTCVNVQTGETRRETENGTVYGQIGILDEVDKANEGVALSLALPTATVDPGKTFGAAANIGTFEGETAIGIAGAFQAADGLTFNGAVGYGLGHGTVGGRAGVNFSW